MTLFYRLLIVLAIAVPSFFGTWLFLHRHATHTAHATPAISLADSLSA